MKKITQNKKKELEEELAAVRLERKEATVLMNEAKALGDLSENMEYTAARETVTRCGLREGVISDILSDCKVVTEESGPRITLGCKVGVTKLNKKTKEPIGTERFFVVESDGNPTMKGTLGVESPLGATILNGTDGEYMVAVNGGVLYRVRKVFGDVELSKEVL